MLYNTEESSWHLIEVLYNVFNISLCILLSVYYSVLKFFEIWYCMHVLVLQVFL